MRLLLRPCTPKGCGKQVGFRGSTVSLTACCTCVSCQRAGLDGEESLTHWKAVNDFNWHRVQQSPNWSVLPEVERVGAGGARAAAASPVQAPTAPSAAVDEADDEL